VSFLRIKVRAMTLQVITVLAVCMRLLAIGLWLLVIGYWLITINGRVRGKPKTKNQKLKTKN